MDDVGLLVCPARIASLLTQLLRSCGHLPTMARRTSRAADRRKSLHEASEYHEQCGVWIMLGAEASGPEKFQKFNPKILQKIKIKKILARPKSKTNQTSKKGKKHQISDCSSRHSPTKLQEQIQTNNTAKCLKCRANYLLLRFINSPFPTLKENGERE